MRAVVQRVSRAAVRAGGETVASIEQGLVALIGVGVGDGVEDARWMAAKIAGMRIFRDESGDMNRGLAEVAGAVLAVSQFTLLGDARRGKRPSFVGAAHGIDARALYERVVSELRGAGTRVETGIFGATMEVELINDGPVTILLDTKRQF